jgi:hypothetical protein
MIPLPKLPTDNLYKFSVVLAFVLITSGFFMMFDAAKDKHFHELKNDSISYNVQTLLKYDSLKRIAENGIVTDPIQPVKPNSSLKGANSKADNFLKRQILLNKLNFELESVWNYTYIDYFSLFIGLCTTILGGSMATVYVKKWMKVQQLQDRLLEIQVQMAEKELKNGRKPPRSVSLIKK